MNKPVVPAVGAFLSQRRDEQDTRLAEFENKNFDRWCALEAHLKSRVIGQEEAVSSVAGALLAGEMGHTFPGYPKSFILMLGPTGTGKTMSAKTSSAFLFGTQSIFRINMAEYPEKQDQARLIGENRQDQGYFGEGFARLQAAGGKIILFDEVEKAHRDIANIILGMEEAQITLGNGVMLNLEDYHIIVTSNLGTADAIEMEGLPYEALRDHVEQEALRHFKPEVLARFTEVIVYRQLTYPVQVEICRQMLGEELVFQAKVMEAPIEFDPSVFNYLVQAGYHETLGARPMRNVIQRRVRRALVQWRLANPGQRGVPLILKIGLNGLKAQPIAKKEKAA